MRAKKKENTMKEGNVDRGHKSPKQGTRKMKE